MPTDSVLTLQHQPQVISVSELNQSVVRLLERSIPLCWIAGEISNFTRASSGHWYFTLKDADAQVRAIMFKSRTPAVDFVPREGEKIEVRATVTLYAPRGDYQLNVEGIRRAGMGNLYEAFLQLKQKLSQAGLFNAERKKPLPAFSQCIGIVTSPQAAALHDVLITLQRRAPHVRVIIYPSPVQGSGAAQKLCQTIDAAISRNECDVLIVTRGGGSMEDLWAFNDEQLALCIARCPIPVISGIGHETDFTIADFVADARAPTPTAAAEIAVTARIDLMLKLQKNMTQLRRALRYRIDQENQTIDHFSHRLINPRAYIRSERARLFNLRMQLIHAVTSSRQQAGLRHAQLQQKLLVHAPDIGKEKNLLRHISLQLQSIMQQSLSINQHQLSILSTQLALLDPQRTLERGYAIVLDPNGHILRKPEQFKTPGNITVKLAQGEVMLSIATIQKAN